MCGITVQRQHSMQGFTLVEVLVVIVIMSVLAGLLLFNTSGIQQRQLMQAREIFLLDLKRVQRAADDQAQVFALQLHSQTDVAPARYEILQYVANSPVNLSSNDEVWQPTDQFNIKSLPSDVSIRLESLEHDYGAAQNTALIGTDAPKMIWLGNGEVKPVRLQFYLAQQPVGAEINIDHLGNIHED